MEDRTSSEQNNNRVHIYNQVTSKKGRGMGGGITALIYYYISLYVMFVDTTNTRATHTHIELRNIQIYLHYNIIS